MERLTSITADGKAHVNNSLWKGPRQKQLMERPTSITAYGKAHVNNSLWEGPRQ